MATKSILKSVEFKTKEECKELVIALEKSYKQQSAPNKNIRKHKELHGADIDKFFENINE